MYKVCCLLFVIFLAGLACAQAEPPAQDTVAQAPPTVDPQAKPGQARAADTWACELPYVVPDITKQLTESCGNHTQRIRVIAKVACQTKGGTVSFQPRLTGGEAQSILASRLTCPPAPEWSTGVLNGQPRLMSYAKNTMTCVGGCSIDFVLQDVQDATEVKLVITGDYAD